MTALNTAEDVAFSLNRAIESNIFHISLTMRQMQVIDEYTVRLNLIAPYVGSLINLTVPFTAIVPKALVESNQMH